MTGYGKAIATYGTKKICAEIKSLNSKAKTSIQELEY